MPASMTLSGALVRVLWNTRDASITFLRERHTPDGSAPFRVPSCRFRQQDWANCSGYRPRSPVLVFFRRSKLHGLAVLHLVLPASRIIRRYEVLLGLVTGIEPATC